jgi:anti-anti-sigma factor
MNGESGPVSLEKRVDEACDRFEAAWRAGQRPRIEDYLAEAPGPARGLLMRELLALEIELRSGEPEGPAPEEYRRRFPGHDELIEAVFAQVSRDRSAGLPDSDEGATTPHSPPTDSSVVAPVPPPVSGSPPVPDQIGRYQVVRRLGGGTFGDVYLAHDGVMDRQVAIKVPSAWLVATERAKEEFLREARSTARLQHEGIVRAYDFGQEADGPCYIVYEFVDGESLAERIKPERLAADPLPPDEAARIVAAVGEALHYAHLQEMFHRDVKPANILLDRPGRPKVTDFGLAVREEDLAAQRGILAGTLPYMSPEQVRREGHHIDGRTDIYSLGVVLYELLCGRRPFEARTKDELEDQILHREARPLRQIKDSIPAQLERICLKALSKRVNERYTTAKDMVDELSRATGRVAAEEGEGTSPDQEVRVIRLNLEERSPAKKLRRALASLNPRDLWRAEATHRNRESAKQLLQEVTRLIEQFEFQYDELMDVLSSSGYGKSVYGSAPRAGRERLLRTNRKLVAIANEMRSIYSGLTRRFILLPDIRATLESITAVCSQIAVAEDFLVIAGVNNSGDLRFDLQKQLELLDGFRPRFDTIVEAGNCSTGDGEALLRDYHLLLLELGRYKIALREEIDKLDQDGAPHAAENVVEEVARLPRLLQVELEGEAAIVHLACTHLLDEQAVTRLRAEFRAFLEKSGARQVTLDMGKVEVVTSVGLATLVSFHRQLRELGGTLGLCGLTPKVAAVFRVSRLHSLFGLNAPPEAPPGEPAPSGGADGRAATPPAAKTTSYGPYVPEKVLSSADRSTTFLAHRAGSSLRVALTV